MEFKHVLITRFNIFYKTKMAEKGYDPEIWLNERFEIFQQFCFPSIINQSSKNFYWFIYLDSETPESIFTQLHKMTSPFKFIRLIEKKFSVFSLRPYLNEDINLMFSDDFQFLITSRVDTDDMLHMDFIAKIQQNFQNQEYCALNFNKGYIYDIDTGVTSVTIHRQNPFISLIEKKSEEGFKTVFHKIHISYKGDPLKIEISNSIPMWCMSVHGLNVSTGFYGKINKFHQPNLKGLFSFGFQKKPSIVSILKFTIRSYQRTYFKIKSKASSVLSFNN
ncbi:MAG: glycosyltransferase [Mongoliitalea sp.]